MMLVTLLKQLKGILLIVRLPFFAIIFLIIGDHHPLLREYSYRSITPEEARRARSKGFVSAVWDKLAADMIRDTLNIDVPVGRRQVSLEVGDIAVVYQIRWEPRETVAVEQDDT
ncbi:MAG TPA: DUF1874 domain-containing protein [Candidatus Methanomethylicus sp.]|nr:DUF1874 domain-containing protein [Candidatus Methanomethylicus sp.]